ncbi:MAG: IS6 family transposase [Thaumarchaeota archaeon]|nr:IS6 family transposase [Nitrososphaerota archaeon]
MNCSCADFVYRAGLPFYNASLTKRFKCKHIFAVELSHALRQAVERQVKIELVGVQTCLFCSSSKVVKHGVLHNQGGDVQRYSCKDCGKRFTQNLGFEGMRASPQSITQAMQLYFTGESLRNVQKFLRLQGVNVSHVAIYKWIRKYVGVMERYLDQITPQLSDSWRADELYVKIRGNMKYLFAMMDDQTRFWIAQEVADSKEKHDARSLFHKSAEVAGKMPRLVITDGLHAYRDAARKEYQTNHGHSGAVHVRDIALKGVIHNNKMERMNGEVRDREKVMRGLKRSDTPILKGYQIYHNYIRPHSALGGKTPAELCGINVQGNNKWLTLIQNAAHVQSVNSETNTEDSV